MREIKNVQEFQSLIAEGKPVLLDFFANWCGPCKALLPTVEKLAGEFKEDINIVKINVDNSPELSKQFAVRSIPALFFINEGEVKERLTGLQPEKVLREKIELYTAIKAS